VALAGEGCRVVITGRREAKLREAAARFTGESTLLTRVLDVADRQNVADVFDWATRELGKIDILVQSAGINVRDRSMADLSPEDWDKLLQVNATGAFNCMRAVLPQMRERRDGLIVNISSIAGLRAALLGGVAYNASKFTTVSLEDGANGIRVTTIFPGEVDTPILEQRPVPVTAEHRAKILQPEDVAAAVLMIACLPPRAHVQELIIKPTSQAFL
jgi:NADP-dependent 3-hydroxy acid dehydrogenase YdfG